MTTSYTLAQVAAFLDGTGKLDGLRFGDRHPTEPGAFWWRKHLRAALAAKTEGADMVEPLGYVSKLGFERLKAGRSAAFVGYPENYADKVAIYAESVGAQAAPSTTVSPVAVAWLYEWNKGQHISLGEKPLDGKDLLYFVGENATQTALGRIVPAVQQGGEAARISPDESADYRRGWKDGHGHGAWASGPAAAPCDMDVSGWRSLADKAIKVLQEHIVPDGISDKEALSRIYSIFDGPECNHLLMAAAPHPLMGNKSAKPAKCRHDWPQADRGVDPDGACTKCGMSFQRYIHTEMP